MQLFGPSGVRSDPRDRNPAKVVLESTQNITNATGAVILVTYTVPAGRRAELSVQISATIDTALAAGQDGSVGVEITGFTQAAPQLFFKATAGINQRDQAEVSFVFVAAGDVVRVNTGALAAGAGVVRSSGAIHGVEYDA